MNHHHYSKQSSSSSSLTRCGVSSLSLSGLSIASDESSSSRSLNAHQSTTTTSSSGGGGGGGMQRSNTLRRGWGSVACNSLSALALYEEQQAQTLSYVPSSSSMAPSSHHQHEQLTSSSQRTASVDTTGDDWGYFVDSNLPSSVRIVW